MNRTAWQGSYLGPEFSDQEIELMIRRFKAKYAFYDGFEKLCKKTATLISEGNAIGWMQGRMEFGPRALGNRSILGDPRNLEMQKKLNLKIKYRESFRPFAPSVLEEESSQYFDLEKPSPYMLLVQPVKEHLWNDLPENYYDLPMLDKLYFQRSSLPAITHIDRSARIQTVNKKMNFRYWQLLSEFKKITDCGVLINTSFNVRGEPIVCTPEDAYRCFMNTEMDYLVIGNYLFDKKEQPEWKQKTKTESFLD